MQPIRIFMRLIFVVLMMSFSYVCPIFANDSEAMYFDLKRDLSRSIKKDLEPELRKFLEAELGKPVPANKLSLAIRVHLGNEDKDSQQLASASPHRFIDGVHVDVGLLLASPREGFDSEIKRFIRQYFDKELVGTELLFRTAPAQLRVTSDVALMEIPFMEEFSRGSIKIAIALLLLFLISLIRYTPQVHALAKAAIDPTVQQEPYVGIALPKHAPTDGYMEFIRAQEEHPVDPAQGSWCLQSLPHLSKDRLHDAFERMPFEQAVLSLKAMRKDYREDVTRRLDLHPALKQKLLSSDVL